MYLTLYFSTSSITSIVHRLGPRIPEQNELFTFYTCKNVVYDSRVPDTHPDFKVVPCLWTSLPIRVSFSLAYSLHLK